MLIFFEDKKGVKRRHAFHRRHDVTSDRSLVISDFTEDDQGLYWCVNCYEDDCYDEMSTVIRVTKEISRETQQTVYVAAGTSFMHQCPGEFTNLKWTFNASETTAVKNSKLRTETDFVSFNKSLHIVNVRRADVGKYTCWTSGCDGHAQKLLTINLCVVTVRQNGNTSAFCAVICDAEFSNNKHNEMSNEETDLRKILVHVKPYGSLNCIANQMFDASGTIKSTPPPSNASSKTTDTNTETEYLTPVIYGTSGALTCLILSALLIFFFRTRLRADISSCADIHGQEEEEEPSVVYASLGASLLAAQLSVLIERTWRPARSPAFPVEALESTDPLFLFR
ncbi:hypothetical protein Q5P01_011506 [Channa striata]|uniref:Ig-like domain-containing protein n=1 Tax=Channa striata TaxID=64152 RepID=A0AA88MZJ2_CHASR|nr:hypothetical protein Q5P01_011506 [Channa striata]